MAANGEEVWFDVVAEAGCQLIPEIVTRSIVWSRSAQATLKFRE
jgi:hypothetical protein